jgi:hypothetical protein
MSNHDDVVFCVRGRLAHEILGAAGPVTLGFMISS